MKRLLRSIAALLVTGCNVASEAGSSADAEGARSAFGAESGVVSDSSAAANDSVHFVARTDMTADVEILSGHPDSTGRPFVIRIRELPGTIVPPHTHPVDEHITVVQGTWYFGTGVEFDSTALRPLPAGSYAFAPAGTTMFAYAPELTVVQVHGIGPFHIDWRHGSQVLDEPGGAAAFRFRKQEAVSTPHGDGTIQQGYRSGSIIQYDVLFSGGERRMVSEHAIRAAAGR
ncbi:MAG TPA: cupin domain-containing protein [Longimicrobiales bacterium]|nr:cupin domain-containing protein [Longimicrobiales bacterium]